MKLYQQFTIAALILTQPHLAFSTSGFHIKNASSGVVKVSVNNSSIVVQPGSQFVAFDETDISNIGEVKHYHPKSNKSTVCALKNSDTGEKFTKSDLIPVKKTDSEDDDDELGVVVSITAYKNNNECVAYVKVHNDD